MSFHQTIGRATLLGGLVTVGLSIAGCAGTPTPDLAQQARPHCVDDSPACIKARQTELGVILADKNKSWIKRPASADSYATGVRLFAYKKRKRDLSCTELVVAHKEAEAGPAVLRGPAGKHLTPAQVSRGAILSTEVSRELQREIHRRCRR